MNEWIQNLAAYFLIAGLATKMLPNSKYEQYVRLFTGFLLILLVIQPVLKIGSVDRYLEEKIQLFLEEQEVLEEEIVNKSEDFLFDSTTMQLMEQKVICIEEIEKVRVEVAVND